MGKIRRAVRFSTAFNVSSKDLVKLGAIDPFLNVDTGLFIDPILLEKSRQPWLKAAHNRYLSHFSSVIRLLLSSKAVDDAPWRAATRLLTFHELPATCLGYGAASTHGSGFGKKLSQRVLQTAKEIVDTGVTDPELFAFLSLFEEDIGPDRISDMVTNVIVPDLAKFTKIICVKLGVPVRAFEIGNTTYNLPENPKQPGKPVILMPRAILRVLPVASSWDDISTVVSYNQALRRRVNDQIARLWGNLARRPKKDVRKSDIRELILRDPNSFKFLLSAARSITDTPYDVATDPNVLFRWYDEARRVANGSPLPLERLSESDDRLEWLTSIVQKIIDRFQDLIEKKGLNTILYDSTGRPQNEKIAQKIFFAVADSYCEANQIDVSPEADTGIGSVDFKFSTGYTERVLVEIKLSRNPNILDGYTKQLEAYKASQLTDSAFYIILNVGGMGNKWKRLTAYRTQEEKTGEKTTEAIVIDAIKKPSASKR